MEEIIYYFLCRGDGLHKKIPPEYSFYLSLLSYFIIGQNKFTILLKTSREGANLYAIPEPSLTFFLCQHVVYTRKRTSVRASRNQVNTHKY